MLLQPPDLFHMQHAECNFKQIAGSLPQAAQVTGCLGDRRDLHNFPVI